MANKEKKKSGFGLLLIIILILGIWGFVGGSIAKDVGITCDIGIGDTLCWTWHKNVVGEISEGINDLFGG